MSNSDSSFSTTYSQDQRIERKLKRLRHKENIEESEIQKNRQQLFNEIFVSKSHSVFQLKGLYFLYVNHLKIKFYFKPRDVIKFVRPDVKFYCKLVFCNKYRWWRIKKDSFPVNYKRRVYSFYYHDSFVTDEEVLETIQKMYRVLLLWSENEQIYREEKFQRFLNEEIEDLDLDSDDLEFFLDERQKHELKAKRSAILKRMMPPKKRTRKHKRIQVIDFGSEDSI